MKRPDARSEAMSAAKPPGRRLLSWAFMSVNSAHPQAGLQSDKSITDTGLYGWNRGIEPFGHFPVGEAAIVCQPHGFLLGIGQRLQAPDYGLGLHPAAHLVRDGIVLDLLAA